MSDSADILISEYNRNPVGFYKLDEFTVSRHEWNFICWDDLTVYLKIDWNIILDFSFDWNPWQVSIASCSLLSEMIKWKSIDEVMQWSYDTFSAQWLDVLPRRRRAVIIWLLAARNAIHEYRNDLKDWSDEILIEEFDDLLDD